MIGKIVKHIEMRRDWWIVYKWANVQTQTDPEPVYLCTGIRPINESLEAAQQFDCCHKHYQHIQAEQE